MAKIKGFNKSIKIIMNTDPILSYARTLYDAGYTEADVYESASAKSLLVPLDVIVKLATHVRDFERGFRK